MVECELIHAGVFLGRDEQKQMGEEQFSLEFVRASYVTNLLERNDSYMGISFPTLQPSRTLYFRFLNPKNRRFLNVFLMCFTFLEI